MKGSRIYSIVKELRNENIDVVNWTANTQLLIQRALNPAKISSITIDEEKKTRRCTSSRAKCRSPSAKEDSTSGWPVC